MLHRQWFWGLNSLQVLICSFKLNLNPSVVVLKQQLLSFCSITAVRRMGLTAPPSPSNAWPATHAVSPAWTGPSSPRCPCLRQNHLAPNMRGGSELTAPPARPMIHPSISAPPTTWTTAADASPTCPLTTRTRLWPCRCLPCTAPCWGTPSEADLRISTPTPGPSALRCNLTDTPCTLTCGPWGLNRDLMVPARLSSWKHSHLYPEEGLPWTLRCAIGTISVVFCYFHISRVQSMDGQLLGFGLFVLQ